MHIIVFLGTTRRHLNMYRGRPSNLYQQLGCCLHQVSLVELLFLTLLICGSRLAVAVIRREVHIIISAHWGGSWFLCRFNVHISNLLLSLLSVICWQVAVSIGIDLTALLTDDGTAFLADNDDLFLKSFAVAMGTYLA